MIKTVYNVIFAGESIVSPMYSCPIEVETFVTKKGARDRVAEFFRGHWREDWHVEERGREWRNDDDGVISIIASAISV